MVVVVVSRVVVVVRVVKNGRQRIVGERVMVRSKNERFATDR